MCCNLRESKELVTMRDQGDLGTKVIKADGGQIGTRTPQC
jgi:hypothetical protein